MVKGSGSSEPIIIKKYANRRLYDTSTSSYVTLDHLSELVREGRDFEVRDAKTGEDLTRQVLTQIIFEQETKGEGALPLNFLRQLIGFYGGGAQTFLRQNLTRQILARLGIANLEVPALTDQFRQVVERHIGRCRRVVEAPVCVFLDDDRLCRARPFGHFHPSAFPMGKAIFVLCGTISHKICMRPMRY